MSLQFFTPKILGSVCIGGGLFAGGGLIYYHQMPRNWKELLIKEGFVFLTSEEDYKAMFHDQKNREMWTSENDLNGVREDNVKEKAETYCQNKLREALSSKSSYGNTKKKLISFCTADGIRTVKAKLIQSKKKNWIEDEEADKWKTVFAIYRYDKRFIDWLKEGSGNDNLSEKSSVGEYTRLKTTCSNLLVKPYGELTDNRYFDYASWWCTDLGYKTVKDKLERDDSWSREENGEAIKNRRKDTESVTNQIRGDLSKQGDSEDLQDDDYKNWCDGQLKKELKENDYYQTKYIMIKSVCGKIT